MKKLTVIAIGLLMSAAMQVNSEATQKVNDFSAFWTKFKAAVSHGDKDAVVAMTRFPLRMPGRVRNIKDADDLRARYAEVFTKYMNAARCFSTEEGQGQIDPDNSRKASAGCFTKPYYDVEYVFERTSNGWKLIGLFREALPD